MYNTTATFTGGGLAATGLTGNPIWLFMAAFALIALGLSLLRTVPRRER
jgi:4-hydroxybenzoate polyprenyltransferase